MMPEELDEPELYEPPQARHWCSDCKRFDGHEPGCPSEEYGGSDDSDGLI
jgi:hypothetical protein